MKTMNLRNFFAGYKFERAWAVNQPQCLCSLVRVEHGPIGE